MRLDYSVVAIDDDAGAASAMKEAAELYLDGEGFDLVWRTCANPGELNEYLASDPRPDLVLVDHRLGVVFDNQTGPRWAAVLRNRHFPFTDILFYGGDSAKELRARMAEADVDGVFCANRADVREALQGIISVHFRRWTEAGAMRGLAVGIAAEMDDLLRAVCLDVATHHGDPVKGTIYSKSAKRAEKRSKERPRIIEKHVKEDALAALLHEHTEFSSADLVAVISWFSECVPGIDAEAAAAFVKRYMEDVIWKRNTLAHGKFDAASQTFTDAKGRTFPVTPESCKQFRVILRSYRKELLAMREAARGGALAFRVG